MNIFNTSKVVPFESSENNISVNSKHNKFIISIFIIIIILAILVVPTVVLLTRSQQTETKTLPIITMTGTTSSTTTTTTSSTKILTTTVTTTTIFTSSGTISMTTTTSSTKTSTTITTTSTTSVTTSSTKILTTTTTSSTKTSTTITTTSVTTSSTKILTTSTTITTTSTTSVTTTSTKILTTTTTTSTTKILTTSSTKTSTTTTKSSDVLMSYGINLVKNGDAEIGDCSTDSTVMLPTPWTAVSSITQLSYNNNIGCPNSTTPGPSNRGKCFFTGGNGDGSTMLQIINVTAYAYDIDRNNTSYNFSAWLGGFSDQNDAASITLIFLNSSSAISGTQVTIGPVYASDRNSVTKFLFRHLSGLVYPNTRYLKVSLQTFRAYGYYCDAYIDNIAVVLNHI